MKRFTHLLRDYQIGEWCKRAAWIIAGLGLLEIIFFLWTKYGDYQFRTSAVLSGGFDLLATLQTVMGLLINIIFLFFLLYAAGGLANHFLGSADNEALGEEEDEENEQP
jgi:uncharacterized membrane protein